MQNNLITLFNKINYMFNFLTSILILCLAGASESTKGKSGWKERGELKVLNRHESGMKVLKKW